MRRIITATPKSRDIGGGGTAAPDGYFDRIIKYIPADIVAGWVALDGLSKTLAPAALWALFGVVAVLSYFWMLKQTHHEGQPPAIRQAVIATVSFAVWAFALQSGPFDTLAYDPQYGSIALILYTLGIGLVVP
jgi:hypothetical protein